MNRAIGPARERQREYSRGVVFLDQDTYRPIRIVVTLIV